MPYSPPYVYPWQNPHLLKTIYPFRKAKLMDFLLIYREVDLWKEKKDRPPDPFIALELQRRHAQIALEIETATRQRDEARKALKAHQEGRAQVYSSPEVRKLAIQRTNLTLEQQSAEAKKKGLERRVAWYQEFAPDHPYHEKWKQELALAIEQFNDVTAHLEEVNRQYEQAIGPFLQRENELNQSIRDLTERINGLNLERSRLPKLGKDGAVSASAAVQWELRQYKTELEALEQDELLRRILERFQAEPERFPKWLQYMVIHFSGMRYQSAHASWADPRELLLALQRDRIGRQITQALEAQIEAQAAQAILALSQARNNASEAAMLRKIDELIARLNNPVTRRASLEQYLVDLATQEIEALSPVAVLERLREMKDQFPSWMWAEIVQRTDLRMEVSDDQWEGLTPEQRQARWQRDSQRWREIMDAWETKDITAWRQEHERTLALVVTRAVCNEIAEHIQHLRGVSPAAGLTAKPVWYLKNQRANLSSVYFKRPNGAEDFKKGASILFLGWVPRQPNAWQIAHPLPGVELLPPEARPTKLEKRSPKAQGDEWSYHLEGDIYTRSTRRLNETVLPHTPKVAPKGEKKVKKEEPKRVTTTTLVKEWLRWTHEAIAVEVAEMSDGRFVLTFETGQIGLNRRPLARLLNAWDIFVGYVPGSPLSAELTARLDEMVLPARILPA